jgi:hypothetical protein
MAFDWFFQECAEISVGQFGSIPVEGEMDLYAYAHNNPIDLKDPNGTQETPVLPPPQGGGGWIVPPGGDPWLPPFDCSPKTSADLKTKSSTRPNKVDAQREASRAFIKNQAGESWRLVKNAYDGGGFSGGAMERPALQRLLTDIRQGLIDVVVVYKVDRSDRAAIMLALEESGKQSVSLVSVLRSAAFQIERLHSETESPAL